MKPIAMVVTDLDGTLLYDRENLTNRDRSCLAALQAQQIPLVFATGREPRLIVPALNRLDLWNAPQYIIYSGGCGIIDVATRTERPIATMSPETLQQIYTQYQGICALSFMISQDDVLYTDHLSPILQNESALLRCEIVEVSDFRAILTKENGKLILCGETTAIEAALPQLTTDTNPRYQFHRSHENYIDCYAHGVNKGAALRRLCSELGVSTADVLAIGDHLNDVELLTTAGHSACPGDAHPAIQKLVHFVACPAQEGAVADACAHFGIAL